MGPFVSERWCARNDLYTCRASTVLTNGIHLVNDTGLKRRYPIQGDGELIRTSSAAHNGHRVSACSKVFGQWTVEVHVMTPTVIQWSCHA